jgi:gliding motility-associated-like protein
MYFILEYDQKMDVAIDPDYEFTGLLNAGNIFQLTQKHWPDSTHCILYFDITPQEVTQETYITITGAKSKIKGWVPDSSSPGDSITVQPTQGASSSADPLIIDMKTIDAEYVIKPYPDNISPSSPIRCEMDSVEFMVTFNQAMTIRRDTLLLFPSYKSPFLKQHSISWSYDRTEAYAVYKVNGNIPSNLTDIQVKVVGQHNLYGTKFEGKIFDDRFNVESNPPVTETHGNPPLCHDEINGTIHLIYTGGSGPFDLSLKKDSIAETIIPTSGYEINVTGLGPGYYSAKAIGTDKCWAQFDTLYINPDPLQFTAHANKHVEFNTSTKQTVNGQIIVNTTGGTLPYHYRVNGDLLSVDKKATDSIADLVNQAYTIKVEDKNGCVSDDELTVSVFDRRTPTIFTPDGIYGAEIFMEGDKIEIFDRTGTSIHKGENGWDGKYKGRPAQPGTYFYMVTFKDGYTKKGTIQLFKK